MDIQRLQELFAELEEEQSSERNDRILIIDGLNMFIRAYQGSPLMTNMGDHIGGVMGFLRSLFFVIRKFRPTRCIVIFDGRDGGQLRRSKFPDYKAGRKNRYRLNRFVDVEDVIDEQKSFIYQFRRVEQYLHILPITMMSIDYIEADDTIGFIVSDYYRDDKPKQIVIVSSDKDFLQLVDENVKVYRPIEKRLYDLKVMQELFNISPRNYLTLRTLKGDVSDNIPGVRGIGHKTLLKYFPEIIERDIDSEGIIELCKQRIEEGNRRKTYQNVISSSEQLTLNWELMQLYDVDIPILKKIDIKTIMDEDVDCIDKKLFKKMIYDDDLSSEIKHIDSWIFSTFNQLDLHARPT